MACWSQALYLSSFSSLNLCLAPLLLYWSVSIPVAKTTPSLWQQFDSLLLSAGLSPSLTPLPLSLFAPRVPAVWVFPSASGLIASGRARGLLRSSSVWWGSLSCCLEAGQRDRRQEANHQQEFVLASHWCVSGEIHPKTELASPFVCWVGLVSLEARRTVHPYQHGYCIHIRLLGCWLGKKGKWTRDKMLSYGRNNKAMVLDCAIIYQTPEPNKCWIFFCVVLCCEFFDWLRIAECQLVT